jgi:hypothetical protein
MRRIESKSIALGELKDSPFREFLGPIPEGDVLAIKEDSISRYGDFWAALRVCLIGDSYHLLFGHRRVRAAIKYWGADHQMKVWTVDCSDEEKIQLLGEAGYRSATDDERTGLVKLASWFLQDYGEGFLGRVDIDLLKAHAGSGRPFEGSTRISKWLGKRLWPHQRISELLAKLNCGVPEQKLNVLMGRNEEVDVSSEQEAPLIDLEQAERELSDIVQGLPPELPKQRRLAEELSPQQVLEKRVSAVKSGITNDLEKRILEPDLRRKYRDSLLTFLQSVHA